MSCETHTGNVVAIFGCSDCMEDRMQALPGSLQDQIVQVEQLGRESAERLNRFISERPLTEESIQTNREIAAKAGCKYMVVVTEYLGSDNIIGCLEPVIDYEQAQHALRAYMEVGVKNVDIIGVETGRFASWGV